MSNNQLIIRIVCIFMVLAIVQRVSRKLTCKPASISNTKILSLESKFSSYSINISDKLSEIFMEYEEKAINPPPPHFTRLKVYSIDVLK